MLPKQVLLPLERPPTVALMAVSIQFNQKTRPRGRIFASKSCTLEAFPKAHKQKKPLDLFSIHAIPTERETDSWLFFGNKYIRQRLFRNSTKSSVGIILFQCAPIVSGHHYRNTPLLFSSPAGKYNSK